MLSREVLRQSVAAFGCHESALRGKDSAALPVSGATSKMAGCQKLENNIPVKS